MTQKKLLTPRLGLAVLAFLTVAITANAAWASKGPVVSDEEKLREQNAQTIYQQQHSQQEDTPAPPPQEHHEEPPPPPPKKGQGNA